MSNSNITEIRLVAPTIEVKVLDERLLTEFGGLPVPATPGAAAGDVRACSFIPSTEAGKPDLENARALHSPVTLRPGQQAFFGLGIAMHLRNPNYVALLAPRSSKGNEGLVLSNTIGVIDSDYQGQLLAAVVNRLHHKEISVVPGERIAQLMIVPVIKPHWTVTTEFSTESSRGEGGFGSTGK
ncbi:dUTP diphosphatase [Thalassospira xianhensis]|uniref:dUTP diphosphatase n=1 Tax=Thalassospira xianhensis TaxID=478503 RepID=UPI000DEDD20F|nr:dUTP diphosphatase [Thalassospira xianhensis]